MRSRRPPIFAPTDAGGASLLADLLRRETVGGVVMLAATVIALIWANVDAGGYRAVQRLGVGPLDLQHWAADGLLAIFFFVAGLELKRELTVGSLSRPAQAVLPIVAAVCGMAVPAALYLVINLLSADGDPSGWAVPMATDIAFALTVLAVAGTGLPTSLRAFLLTLAIVDDLGAILVIALAFSHGLRPGWLVGALGCVVLWTALQRLDRRIRIGGWVYPTLALGCWVCTYAGGVHATIAGVALGLATRSRPHPGAQGQPGGPPGGHDHPDPTSRWEHRWRPVSAGVAVPVFALLSAGVTVTPHLLGSLVSSPITLGIAVGLIIGKTLGVFGGTVLTARLSRAELTAELSWHDVFAVAVLAGVGFTVALLMSELSFDAEGLVEQAKAAVLVASTVAAVIAVLLLRRRASTHRRHGEGATSG